MYKFCVFAGTTEGREIIDFLTAQEGSFVAACVATEYGEELLEHKENLHIYSGRMTEGEMENLLDEDFDLVIDATHPYAKDVTENIAVACEKKNRKYMRVIRESSVTGEGVKYFSDAEDVVAYLNAHSGNILLTTGSKDLGKFKEIENFSERAWARVLPMEDSLDACKTAGLGPAHIIAMQGPFSEEMNEAMLRSMGAKFLVTKDGGKTGGFLEKVEAAEKTGATLLVMGRPEEKEGKTIGEFFAYAEKELGFTGEQKIVIAGIGPGSEGEMTVEVREAIDAANLLIGAGRMLEKKRPGQQIYKAVNPKEISEYIKAHKEFKNIVVLMSGDTGFYSGTKKLLPLLEGRDVKILPGISSLSGLAARIGMAYDDIKSVSLHGRDVKIANYVKENGKVFVLTGGENSPDKICSDLVDAGLGDVDVYIGERISYPEEKISAGIAEDLMEGTYDGLSAMIIENKKAKSIYVAGLPDDAFERLEGVPMTKSEVRAVCLSKLALPEDAICWDIGAGTGSVSIEMALQAKGGKVYAVEKKADACELAEKNKENFGIGNIEVINGTAPEVCDELPAPTHVFIGGSSGKAREIIQLALGKNPEARIVATAITLESIGELNSCMEEFFFDDTEVVSITVARDKKAGSYHIMTGQNPIYIFTMQKK